MTEREAYVAFNLTEKVGFATVSKLVLEYGSVVDAWEALLFFLWTQGRKRLKSGHRFR